MNLWEPKDFLPCFNIYRRPIFTMMGIIRSAIIGACTWWMLIVLDVKPPVAAAIGISCAFFTEAMVQANAKSHLRHKATSLQSELNIAIGQLTEMKRALDLTTSDLREALDELHRRDAIGSPAARELLTRQEEAMEAQRTAIEVSTDRSFETLESLERMIISQGEQTARVQEVLSMVLKQLALEPRQHINMRDSVLTQENSSTPAMTDDLISLMG